MLLIRKDLIIQDTKDYCKGNKSVEQIGGVMPRGYPKEMYPNKYGGEQLELELEIELPSYSVIETADSHQMKIRLDQQYLVCDFCGTPDPERRGSEGSAATSWCMKCGRAYSVVWKKYVAGRWIDIGDM